MYALESSHKVDCYRKTLSIIALCDADWISDSDDRRSNSRSPISLGPNSTTLLLRPQLN